MPGMIITTTPKGTTGVLKKVTKPIFLPFL